MRGFIGFGVVWVVASLAAGCGSGPETAVLSAGSNPKPSPATPGPVPVETPAPTSPPQPSASASPSEPIAEHWLSFGPEGGRVSSIAISPTGGSRVLAAGAGGLFESEDWGATWKRTATDVVNGSALPLPVDAVAIGPDGSTAMLGVGGVGVFATELGSGTWSRGIDGLFQPELASEQEQAPSIVDISFDPAVAGTALAAGFAGVFRTTDGGQSWERVTDRTEVLDVREVEHATADEIYAAAGTLRHSRDGGRSWTGTQMPASALAVSPDAGTVFTAGRIDSNGGVFKTTNRGFTWETISQDLQPYTDRWDVYSLACSRHEPQTLFVGSDIGFYRTTNGGDRWEEILLDDVRRVVTAIAIHPDRAGHMIVGTQRGGLFRSEDDGATWHAANHGFVASTVFTVAPGNAAGELYAGTTDGVFRTRDWGWTWERPGRPLRTYDVGEIVVSPEGTLFALTEAPLGNFINPGGLARSVDEGESWVPILGASSRGRLLLAPDPPHQMWLAEGHVFHSSDGGDRWVRVPIENPSGTACDGMYGAALTRDASGARVLLVTLGSRLLEVRDFAPGPSGNLRPTLAPCPDIGLGVRILTSIATPVEDEQVAHYVASHTHGRGDGLVRLTKRMTYEAVPIEDDPNAGQTVHIDPAHPRLLFVGTDGHGLHVSTDGGDSCRAWNENLGGASVLATTTADDGNVLVLGTQGAGVTVRSLREPEQ